MEERLARLAELRAAAAEAVTALEAEREAITDTVKAEERKDLTEEETVAYRAKTREIKDAQLRVTDLDEQIAELEEERERAGHLDERAQKVAKSTARVTVESEARTYEKGNGHSYVQDLMRRHFRVEDEETEARLRRHAAEVRTDKEMRDLSRTDGQGGSEEVATVAA